MRAAFAAVALGIGISTPAFAEKNVILARTSPDIVIVWKVNDDLGALAQRHLDATDLQNAMIARALAVMHRAVPADAAPGETITAKLVYFNNGGYDPNYKIETVSGVRRVGEVTTTAGSVRRLPAAWTAGIAHGHVPSAVKATFAGDAFTGLAQ